MNLYDGGSAGSARNPAWFRQILAQYPTGVCLVTSTDEDGASIGMTVGSFTSVSLDPPLVAFLPQHMSSTYARIRAAGRFCVNILSAEQESVCRTFASRMEDRFAQVPYRLSPGGLPIIRDCIAWIECTVHEIVEAGDHDIVIGAVESLDAEANALPLLFYQGGYGHFSSIALTVQDPFGHLTRQLRWVDLARPVMEALAERLDARCVLSVRVDDDIVIAASAASVGVGDVTTFVGQRVPFLPPSGSLFAAGLDQEAREAWLMRAPPEQREACRASLDRAAARGYSLVLDSEAQRAFALALAEDTPPVRAMMHQLVYEPSELSNETCGKVRLIAVPVGTPGAVPEMALSLYGFARLVSRDELDRLVVELKTAAERMIGARTTAE